jgi:hypothetical protein
MMLSPLLLTDLMVALCESTELKDNSICNLTLFTESHSSITNDLANALRVMDPKSNDGNYFCHYMLQGLCSAAEIPEVDLSSWWAKRDTSLSEIHSFSPNRDRSDFKVLHIAGIHLALLYEEGAEAHCVDFMCCTSESVASPFEPAFELQNMVTTTVIVHQCSFTVPLIQLQHSAGLTV